MHSIPTFPYESQKTLYTLRRDVAFKLYIPFDPDQEKVRVALLY